MLTINNLSHRSRLSYNGNIRNYSCVYPAIFGWIYTMGVYIREFLRNPPFGRTAQERARAGSYALLAQCPAPSFPPLNGSVGRSQNTVQALIPKTPIFKKKFGASPQTPF